MELPTDILFEIERKVTDAFAWYNLVVSCKLFQQKYSSDENKRRFSRICVLSVPVYLGVGFGGPHRPGENISPDITENILRTTLPNGARHGPTSSCWFSGMVYSWHHEDEYCGSVTVIDPDGALYKLHGDGKIPTDDVIYKHQIIDACFTFREPHKTPLQVESRWDKKGNLQFVTLGGNLVFAWDDTGQLIYQGPFGELGPFLQNELVGV